LAGYNIEIVLSDDGSEFELYDYYEHEIRFSSPIITDLRDHLEKEQYFNDIDLARIYDFSDVTESFAIDIPETREAFRTANLAWFNLIYKNFYSAW
jgi:hypothetical protein